MRRRLTYVACSSATVLALTSIAVAADVPQPGLWQVASKTERRGVVKEQPVRTFCMTPEKARNFSESLVRDFNTATGTCRSIDPRKTDTGVNWSIQCGPEMPLKATATYVLDGPQRYVATIRSEAMFAGRTLISTRTTEGRRIGECPK